MKPMFLFFPEEQQLSSNTDKVIVTGKCPNASNPYHKCVEYCHERWGIAAEIEHNQVCDSYIIFVMYYTFK